jgi:hypothetical protein
MTFCHTCWYGLKLDLFRFGSSNPIMSSGQAKTKVIVTIARVVPVTTGCTAIARPVVPGTATDHTLRVSF